MKRIIKQNGIQIDTSPTIEFFKCLNCGCEFESDEYRVESKSISLESYYIEVCPVCKSEIRTVIERDNANYIV
jgi:predicted Zn-ribbon and HTH transcriptional regulator